MSLYLFPIYYIDSPQILNASVTPIPGSGSAPLQVVADSGSRAAYAVSCIDTSGDFIGLYTGSVGNEVLRCIFGGGTSSYNPVVIGAHSRVSLRSISTSSITNGSITIAFMGQGLQ